MDEGHDRRGKGSLRCSLVRTLDGCTIERQDLLEVEEGEEAQVGADHRILNPQKELVEAIGAGARGIEPDSIVSRLRLAELGAIRLRHQWRRQPIGTIA